LTGKYNEKHPFPEGSQRAVQYNGKLKELSDLNKTLSDVGKFHQVSAAQVAMAWAIAKGTLPIIGVTKVSQVNDAADVAKLNLSRTEIDLIEKSAKEAGVSTIQSWEKDMSK